MAASYQPEPGLVWDNVPAICNRWSERVLGLYQDTMTQGLNVCPPVTPQGVFFLTVIETSQVFDTLWPLEDWENDVGANTWTTPFFW